MASTILRAPPPASAAGGDHVGSDAAIDRTVAKAPRQRLGRGLRGTFEQRRVAGFDFVPERSSLAIGDSRLARRGGPALMLHRLD